MNRYIQIWATTFFSFTFSWRSSRASADLDLKGKGYGFGFVFGDDWVHIKDRLGFMWVVANFQVGLGRVGVVSSSRLKYQDFFTTALWLNFRLWVFFKLD